MKRLAFSAVLALSWVIFCAGSAQASNGPWAMRYWGSIETCGFPANEVTRPQDLQPDVEIRQLIEKYNPKLAAEMKQTILHAILRSSEKHGLDPLLVAGVVAAESSFRPRATSHCGARGLMQLTRMVWPYVGVTDPYDAVQNIEGGCRFLSAQLARFRRLDLTLAAYNAGPGIVGRLMRVPDFTETKHYVRRVVAIQEQLSERFQARVEQRLVLCMLTQHDSPDPILEFAHPVPGIPEWRTEKPWPAESENTIVVPEVPIKGLPEQRRLPT